MVNLELKSIFLNAEKYSVLGLIAICHTHRRRSETKCLPLRVYTRYAHES